MKPSTRLAMAFAVSIGVTAARTAQSQTPCSVSPVHVDSARNEVMAVLTSDGQVMKEIREEQSFPKDLPAITVIRDATICARAATAFGHSINKGDSFVVLRIGPLYYAREPYQRRGTGVLMDTAYKVVARLGVPIK